MCGIPHLAAKNASRYGGTQDLLRMKISKVMSRSIGNYAHPRKRAYTEFRRVLEFGSDATGLMSRLAECVFRQALAAYL